MARITVKSELFRWALERSNHTEEDASEKWVKFVDWITEVSSPTVHQLEEFSKWTQTPFGYLLLETPPEDNLPIPDFRTSQSKTRRPSPNLLETVQAMQRRQDWFREFLIEENEDSLPFVGAFDLKSSPEKIADAMRDVLGLEHIWASHERNWSDAVRLLKNRIEEAGIMVVVNGVVGNNNRRRLEVEEFRGFVLVDRYAPLVFINGRDAQCAQMFTLAHELAHIFVGREGVSNLRQLQPTNVDVEIVCDKAAAEFLVPKEAFVASWREVRNQNNRFQLLAGKFKVSAIVAARRALDLNRIEWNQFNEFYEKEIRESNERVAKQRKQNSGGDFWKTQGVRIGSLFGSAVAQATSTGRLLYRDAYKLTGLQGRTFDNFIARLGLKGT
ncbi:MAG: ImmA/IrrE family metallo-endopeptidase [Phycisphaerae bacterium]|nr:ImmA/IrrE family metallo-endopeptidase [Phycisphaerae bacterium]